MVGDREADGTPAETLVVNPRRARDQGRTRQGLVEHLVRELDEVDFFRAEERRASLIRAITVMLERRQWTGPEVHLMRGMIKDLVGGRKARQKVPTTG